MLVEYKNEIFNAEPQGKKINIWKYVPVEGFEKITNRRGITYYEKNIDMTTTHFFLYLLKQKKMENNLVFNL